MKKMEQDLNQLGVYKVRKQWRTCAVFHHRSCRCVYLPALSLSNNPLNTC